MATKEMLKQYFNLQERIFAHFGYKEDWVTIPLLDLTEQYWFLTGEVHGGQLVHYNSMITPEVVEKGAFFSGPVYTQRFLPRWVYRADDCTMVCFDTQTDGNRYLAVMSNDREQKDPALLEAFRELWA